MVREGCTINDININVEEDYVVLLNYNQEEETARGYVKYRIVSNNPLKISLSEVWIDDELKNTFLEKMIECAVEEVYSIGGEVIPGCKEIEDYMKDMEERQQEIEKKKYIREIEPQGNDGSKKLIVDSEYSFIEYPVRDAVKRMNESGMKTIMSSCNREDVENGGINETTIGEHIVIGQNAHFSIGNGYAWIMVDYRMLTEDLKQKIIDLNSGKIVLPLSDRAKRYFNENCMANNCEATQSELVKFYRVWQKHPTEVTETFPHRDELDAKIAQLKSEIEEIEKEQAELPPRHHYKSVEKREKSKKLNAYIREKERCDRLSDKDKYFEDNMTVLYHENSLGYNGSDYKAVVFRYPVGEDTTVEEVQNYFQELLNLLVLNKDKGIQNTQKLGKETSQEQSDVDAVDIVNAELERQSANISQTKENQDIGE